MTVAVLAGAVVGLTVGRAIPMPVEGDPAPWWMPAGALVAAPAAGLILVLLGVYVSCLRTVTREPARLLREE